MRTLILIGLSLAMSSVHAARLSKEDKEYCTVMGIYTFQIALRKVQGVPHEQVWNVISDQFQVHPTLVAPVQNLIRLIYDEEVVFEDASQLAAMSAEVESVCLDLRQSK